MLAQLQLAYLVDKETVLADRMWSDGALLCFTDCDGEHYRAINTVISISHPNIRKDGGTQEG
jgi:hypothetical protein